jgi:phosphatidylglycerol---prolipoprotein diacylglyceryl transferase
VRRAEETLTTRWLGRPSLIRVGRLAVPSYLAMLYVGCVTGTLAGFAVASASGIDGPRFALATAILLVPALAGSRLWFVLQHLELFRADPHRIWRRSEGGMALYGGLVLGMAASVPLLAFAGLPFWRYWDAASITMLVGLVLTRVGCLMHGCCAGRATSGRVRMWLPDHQGRWEHRFPTPLLEAVWGLLVLGVALAARPEISRPGALFAGVAGAYAAARIVLEPTRETAREGPPLNIAFSATLLAVAAALLIRWPL